MRVINHLRKFYRPTCFPRNWKLIHTVWNYYITGCILWLWNLVSHVERGHRLRVFENKVLRKIFGNKRDEIAGKWRKLHNAELNPLYSLSNIIRSLKSRRLRWAGHVARMEQSRNAYRVLVGQLEGKRSILGWIWGRWVVILENG